MGQLSHRLVLKSCMVRGAIQEWGQIVALRAHCVHTAHTDAGILT